MSVKTSMGAPSSSLKMSGHVVAMDAVSVPVRPSCGDCQLTNLGTRVRPIFRLVLAMAILAATLANPAHAQGGPVYLVTYVDVMPNAVCFRRGTPAPTTFTRRMRSARVSAFSTFLSRIDRRLACRSFSSAGMAVDVPRSVDEEPSSVVVT